jgi:acyl carrier protein
LTEGEAYALLNEVFREVFMRDDIRLSAALTANDVEGWDSFKQIEIIAAVQEQCRIKFSSREFDQMTCVGNLAALIAAKTGA